MAPVLADFPSSITVAGFGEGDGDYVLAADLDDGCGYEEPYYTKDGYKVFYSNPYACWCIGTTGACDDGVLYYGNSLTDAEIAPTAVETIWTAAGGAEPTGTVTVTEAVESVGMTEATGISVLDGIRQGNMLVVYCAGFLFAAVATRGMRP